MRVERLGEGNQRTSTRGRAERQNGYLPELVPTRGLRTLAIPHHQNARQASRHARDENLFIHFGIHTPNWVWAAWLLI